MKHLTLSIALILCSLSFSQTQRDTIFFRSGSYDIGPDQKAKLSRLPKTALTLEGRADPHGNETSNEALAENRVNRVAEFLAQSGHNRDSLLRYSFGENNLLSGSSNSTKDHDNRSVIISYKEEIIPFEFDLKKPEVFTFDNLMGINVTLINGTKISIPPLAFESDEIEPITLNVRSFNTKADFILAGLHSMSGDELLESAGMYIFTQR